MEGCTTYGKISSVLSLILLVVWVVAFASPEWMYKELVNPAIGFNSNVTLGLFKQCKVTTFIPRKIVKQEDCGSDGAYDWQMIAAGLAIASLVLSFTITVLTFALAFVPKVKDNLKLKFLLAVIQFLTVGGITSVLIIYIYNNEFPVPNNLLPPFNFDLSWGYYTAITADSLAFLYLLCTLIEVLRKMPAGDSR